MGRLMIYEYNKVVCGVRLHGYECHDCERRFDVYVGISTEEPTDRVKEFLKTHSKCGDEGGSEKK
jgi:transposase-like protein